MGGTAVSKCEVGLTPCVSSICSAVMCKNNFQLTYNKRKVHLIFCEILLHVMMGL